MINISDKMELLTVFPVKRHASFWVETVFFFFLM